jgi:VWFA-related protein
MLSLPFLPVLSGWALARDVQMVMRASLRLLATTFVTLLLGVGMPAQQNPPAQPPGAQPPGAQPPPAQPPAGQPPAAQPPAGQPPANPQQPAGQRPPVFRGGINFVSVDVIVTDKKTNDVVLDLTKDDFEVREDRKPQRVDTFELVKIDPVVEAATPPREIRSLEDEEREAKLPNVRLFVIFLDDYHVRRGNDLFVRKPLLDFVQNDLGPQDMVAIMYPLTPVTALTFTRNRESLVAAISKFEGRKGIYEPRNEFEEKYYYYPTATVEQIRNDVSMSAVKGAAVRLGGMREGRKSIIYVSEGFVAQLPPQLNDPSAAMPHVGNRVSPGVEAPTDSRSQSNAFFNEADLMNRLKEVFDTCNRNNTSIYAVDPRGLAAFEYGVEQGVGLQTDKRGLDQSLDTLRVVADNTDGRAIINRNDLATGMKQIIRDSSGYYLIGYNSASAPTDGKFHTIDVKVRRPGVEVRARKGYWAYTTEDVARANAPEKAGPPPEVSNALSAIAEPASAGRAARFWIGTERGQNGQAHVTFVWEPIGGSTADHRGSETAARVSLTATAEDGRPVFRGKVPDTEALAAASDSSPPVPGYGNLPAAGTSANAPPAASTTPGASASFDVPPGPIELRMIVESDRGQVIDSSTRTLQIPDFTKTQVAIGTPKVFRARTAREFVLARNNPSAVPTAARDFSRTERLLIRFDAYANGGAAPAVTAKLLNRAGQKMSDIPVQANAGQPFQIDFILAPLAAGEYILELDAKSADNTAQQMIGFKVGT